MPLPPIEFQVWAGNSADFPRQTPNNDGTFGGIFTGTEIITAVIWPEGSEAPVLTQAGPPNAWIKAAESIWIVSLNDGQTAALAPGVYRMLVTAPQQVGRTVTLFWGLVEVFATPGTAIPKTLASAYYVGKALTEIAMSPGQWEYLPDNIAAASSLIKAYCNRSFVQGIYTEIVPVEQNGTIRLREIPINQMLRVQNRPQMALSISNPSATTSWVNAVQTGDAYSGLTVTGIQLNWQSGGATLTQQIPFTPSITNEAISALATAVNAFGSSGWSATADPTLGNLPCSELYDLIAAKGADLDDSPATEANYHVFSGNVSRNEPHPDRGQFTGIWLVGRQYRGLGPRWGPGYNEFDDDGGGGMGMVRATYNGGFVTVPLPIQMATAELVKANYERLKTEAYLASENDGTYGYQLAVELIGNLPPGVRQTLDRWKITNA